MTAKTNPTTTVPGVHAEHLTLTKASTGTRNNHLTVVWTDEIRGCGTDCHETTAWDADTPPNVWDTSGCGDWQIASWRQCGTHGTLIGPRARLVSGHLHGAALTAVAENLAADRDADSASRDQTVTDRLTEELAVAAEQVTALGYDPTDMPDDLTDLPDDLADIIRGNELRPGISVTDGRLEAWDYGADGEAIIVFYDPATSRSR